MNKLDFNNKEFKEAILNNIENKENLDQELLDEIIENKVGELAKKIANEYVAEIELQYTITRLKKCYTEHMVNKEDYDYLGLNEDEDNALVRINNVDFDDYRGEKYFDFLIYVDSTDVFSWERLFIKRSGIDEDFEETEIDDRTCELLEWHMVCKNNN